MWLGMLVLILATVPILSLLSGPQSRAAAGLALDEFRPVALLPFALAMESFLPDKFRGWESERLMPRIILLYGTNTAGYHLQIHLAAKCLGGWSGCVLASFLGLAGMAEPAWMLLVPAAGATVYFLSDRQLDVRYAARCRALEQAFPGFVSKMALLVGAGMHVRQAIARIVQEQTSGFRREKNALLDELTVVLADIAAGMSEQQAYGELSERCRIREISNFTGILLQHMRLGGNQLLFELRRMSTESWETRKHAARRYAEEASSKLVFPLVLMFLAVVLVSVAPAFLSIGSLR